MSVIPNEDKRVAQLIDANLDRAREGLRVIEDWCRFGLKNKDLVKKLKNWRQILGREHLETYKKARSVSSDQGAGLDHPAQKERTKPQEIIVANFSRVQEALRVLEEFTRVSNSKLSRISAQIRYEIYDLEVDVLKAFIFNERLQILKSCKLCLITKPVPNLISIVSSALKSGVRMIQFRCKEGEDIDNLVKAKAIACACKEYKSLFIINDRIDIAIASEADGVHLGQKDIPIDIARAIIGNDKIIGLSTHSLKQIKTAQTQDCDYIGIGPIFNTISKPEKEALGIDFLKTVKDQSLIPWFAIGGINQSNISKVNLAGAKRIAVINAIMNAEDPYTASEELLEKIK